MSDSNNSTDDEPDAITVEIPLDPAHRRMVVALRKHGVPVIDVLEQNLTPQAEAVLHDALQTAKYGEEADAR